jgi:DNA-binding NtrC family response regulator
LKILVIDDETIVLDSCKKVLGVDGIEVALATSADKALEVMTTATFSLILVDVKMPHKDGLSLLKDVKEKWPDIPIIVMSGYATPETIDEVSKSGAATFIAKPFTPDELLEAIRQVMEKEESHGEEEGPCH